LNKDTILTLYKFIDWVMTLPEDLEIQYNECIHELEEARAMRYITSAERIGIKKGFEEGLLQGIEQGRQEGKRYITSAERIGIQKGIQKGEYLLLLQQLKYKFAEVPEIYRKRLEEADAKMLIILGKRLLKASHIKEVFDN
ncbi:MAG: hypothetical protein WBE18_07600, partial [Gammaproteobacteria bacterium]